MALLAAVSAPGHIHAVHGFLAAGKTTFARRLERDLPGLRFNTDEWVVALHGPDLGPEEFPGAARRVTAELDRLWPRAASLGLHVVLDYGFWARRHRDALRAQAAALGVPLTLYALSVPADVARARIARRNREPGALHLPAEAFDRLWPRYEPPDADEAVVWVPQPDR
ncbi:AAA family ATPase [Deinococcus enclensis]|uniref:Kinase n=1 Tax=Deinococcus enclensis TaxID=1049582 RepID=A0ABT9M9Z6_9DEIO|nr:AAA family ATPase [Deinococcus enclensis]MDP9763393.1 putative kinase [Deinococcus enclensis]